MVPAWPFRAFMLFSIDVIIAFLPPPSIKSMVDFIFGPMVPGGNCPSSR